MITLFTELAGDTKPGGINTWCDDWRLLPLWRQQTCRRRGRTYERGSCFFQLLIRDFNNKYSESTWMLQDSWNLLYHITGFSSEYVWFHYSQEIYRDFWAWSLELLDEVSWSQQQLPSQISESTQLFQWSFRHNRQPSVRIQSSTYWLNLSSWIFTNIIMSVMAYIRKNTWSWSPITLLFFSAEQSRYSSLSERLPLSPAVSSISGLEDLYVEVRSFSFNDHSLEMYFQTCSNKVCFTNI